jgi:hypothetical protein
VHSQKSGRHEHYLAFATVVPS